MQMSDINNMITLISESMQGKGSLACSGAAHRMRELCQGAGAC